MSLPLKKQACHKLFCSLFTKRGNQEPWIYSKALRAESRKTGNVYLSLRFARLLEHIRSILL